MAIGKNFKQGIYSPVNREKYKGVNNPTYRSSWELHVFKYLDRHPKIIEWYSELPIPYYSEVKGRMSRYMVDIYVVYEVNGERRTELIEIKPFKETLPAVKGRTPKAQKRYVQESLTYINNQEKWQAAKKYAEERGWQFRILTEKEIFRG